MTFTVPKKFDFSRFAKPLTPPKTPARPFFFSSTNLRFNPKISLLSKRDRIKIGVCKASTTSTSTSVQEEDDDPASTQLFEKLKDAERERINKLEELERKANNQLETQIVMASDWSRMLLTMRGKLKGTEWDCGTLNTHTELTTVIF